MSSSPAVQDESIVVKQLFKFARSRKLIGENPLADYKLQEPPSVSKPVPSLEQLNAILAAADGELWIWLLVLALTGMRVGDLPPQKHQWFFTAAPGSRYPEGDHWISAEQVNRRLAEVLKRLGLPAGREAGFVAHSMRHFFETYTVNANIPQRAVDTWLGHRSDKSMGSVYYRLLDHDSQSFIAKVPFDEVARELAAEAAPLSGT